MTGKLTGSFTSSPFTCGSAATTAAPFTAFIKWKWEAGNVVRGRLLGTRVNGGVASGSFGGSALTVLTVPGAISGGCAEGAVRSISVSGTIDLGSLCGHTGNPVSIYVIAPPICGVRDFPAGITAGPDGALWFTANDAGLIGRMTTSGATTIYPSPIGGGTPRGNGGITVGSDGALWYLTEGAVGRMTVDGSSSVFPLPAGDAGEALTAGPDGALWFVYDSLTANGIGRLTTSGDLTMYTDPALGSSDWSSSDHRDLTGITTGPDGALWFAMQDNSTIRTAWIGRMSTSGVVSDYVVPWESEPTPLVAGPDGAIWFSGEPACTGVVCVSSIGRVTTDGHFTEYTSPSGQIGLVAGLAAGPDGALWFTNFVSPGQSLVAPGVGRITTDGTITTYDDPAMQLTLGIAAGPDGAMWFANMANGTIGRVALP